MGAIADLAEASGKRDLARKAIHRWNLYLAVEICAWGGGAFLLMSPELTYVVAIPFGIAALAAVFLMMGLMVRASREIS